MLESFSIITSNHLLFNTCIYYIFTVIFLIGARFLVHLNSSNNVLNSQHANEKAHSSLGSSKRTNHKQRDNWTWNPFSVPIPYGSTLKLFDRSLKIRSPVVVKRAEFIRDRKVRTTCTYFQHSKNFS